MTPTNRKESTKFTRYTHTLRFNGHFPGEPGLAGCRLGKTSELEQRRYKPDL